MNKITLLILILVVIPLTFAIKYQDLTTYNQIRFTANTMESPKQIHNYLWNTTNYKFFYYKRPLNDYWETREGDCTEVARVEYIMFKTIGYKARISHGYLNGFKHDYAEYWEDYQWKSPNPTIIRKGRGIW